MKHFYWFLVLIVLAGSVASCSGSKSYAKKAKQLEEAGLNDEAASFYLQSLQRNSKNVDAKIGLKITGQKQIERTLNDFYKAYSVGNYNDAVKTYLKALYYRDTYGNFVTMEVPAYYDAYYQEMLDLYLVDIYEKASDFHYEERFKEANALFKEIVKLDPQFKDAKELSLITKIEPLYREGVVAFDTKHYRSCYYIMDDVLEQMETYKDAIDYKERALEAGRITIAILPFESKVKGSETYANSIQSQVVSGLTNIKDPFVRVIDRSNMDELINEQKINVHGVNTGSSAIETGELLGANVLVVGKIINYTKTGGRIQRTKRNGFESYTVKLINKETQKEYKETRYKRVTYTEYEGAASVNLEVQYQLVSAETGQVISAKVESDQKSDAVNYVIYNGNYKRLYAGKYAGKGVGLEKGDVIYNSNSAQRKLRRKVTTSKRTLKSFPELTSRAVQQVSNKIVNGVSKYNPDEENI